MDLLQKVLRHRFDYDDTLGTLLYRNPSRYTPQLKGRPVGSVGKNGYVATQILGKHFYIHRLVWIYNYGNIPDRYTIDHLDGNPLNNRIANLRLATQGDNNINRAYRPAVGVYKHNKIGKCWQARIGFERRNISLGYFSTKEEAIVARKRAERQFTTAKQRMFRPSGESSDGNSEISSW